MKYLVCRVDALRPNGHMRTSEYFPMVVEANTSVPDEEIVRMALSSISRNYIGMHEYIVAPLTQATVVSFRPRQQYDVDVRRYDA